MAMRERPRAPLVLNSLERAILERQVRRHRVASALSERSRVVPRCAERMLSNSVASELGLNEHTVGKGRRCLGISMTARLAKVALAGRVA